MAVSVCSPVDGENNLSSNVFYVSGNSPPNVPIYAYVVRNGGQPVIGMMISLPPSFVFQFNNVPAGSNYTLTVQDYENPPSADVVLNLTVG